MCVLQGWNKIRSRFATLYIATYFRLGIMHNNNFELIYISVWLAVAVSITASIGARYQRIISIRAT